MIRRLILTLALLAPLPAVAQLTPQQVEENQRSCEWALTTPIIVEQMQIAGGSVRELCSCLLAAEGANNSTNMTRMLVDNKPPIPFDLHGATFRCTVSINKEHHGG